MTADEYRVRCPLSLRGDMSLCGNKISLSKNDFSLNNSDTSLVTNHISLVRKDILLSGNKILPNQNDISLVTERNPATPRTLDVSKRQYFVSN